MSLLQAVETLVVGALLWLVNRYRSESTNLKMQLNWTTSVTGRHA